MIEIKFDDNEIRNLLTQVTDLISSIGTAEAIAGKEAIDRFVATDEGIALISSQMGIVKELSLNLTFIHVTLFYFGLLTIQHSSKTRYVSEDETSPLDFYTAAFPPVARLPVLCSILSDALKRLHDIGSSLVEVENCPNGNNVE